MDYTSITGFNINEAVEEKSLTEILQDSSLNLTESQIDVLKNLTFQDEYLLDLKDTKVDSSHSNDFFYEIIGMIHEKGYKETHKFLSELTESEELTINGKLIFKSPIFESEQIKYLGEIERMRDKIERETKGLFPCKKCGSKNTNDTSRQNRSGDEMATFYIICNSCGYTFTV